MVAPKNVRKAWWTMRGLWFAVLGVVVIGLSLTSDDSSRYIGLLLGTGLVLLAVAVTFLWRRDKL